MQNFFFAKKQMIRTILARNFLQGPRFRTTESVDAIRLVCMVNCVQCITKYGLHSGEGNVRIIRCESDF